MKSMEAVRLRNALETIAAKTRYTSVEELRDFAGKILDSTPIEEGVPLHDNPHIVEELESFFAALSRLADQVGERYYEDIEEVYRHAFQLRDYMRSSFTICGRCRRPVFQCNCLHTLSEITTALQDEVRALIPDDFGVKSRRRR